MQPSNLNFNTEKGIAYCGMACVLCNLTSHEECPGCTVVNDDPQNDCWVRKCARTKRVDGCFACTDYPCGKDWPLLKNKRNMAFVRYAHEFGKQALMERLRINHENGIVYNRPGTKSLESGGDYDVPETEDEIYRLLSALHRLL